MKGLELCSERKRVKVMLDNIRRRVKVWLYKHLLQVMLWIVALLFGGNLCIMFTSLTDSERGTFGDQFGAANGKKHENVW